MTEKEKRVINQLKDDIYNDRFKREQKSYSVTTIIGDLFICISSYENEVNFVLLDQNGSPDWVNNCYTIKGGYVNGLYEMVHRSISNGVSYKDREFILDNFLKYGVNNDREIYI
jgi:hypothetical protein